MCLDPVKVKPQNKNGKIKNYPNNSVLVFRCTQPYQSPDAWIMRFFLWVWLEAWFWILIIGNSHSASVHKNVNTGKSGSCRMHGEIKYVFISASIEVNFKMTVILLSAIANCLYFFRHSIDNMRIAHMRQKTIEIKLNFMPTRNMWRKKKQMQIEMEWRNEANLRMKRW